MDSWSTNSTAALQLPKGFHTNLEVFWPSEKSKEVSRASILMFILLDGNGDSEGLGFTPHNK